MLEGKNWLTFSVNKAQKAYCPLHTGVQGRQQAGPAFRPSWMACRGVRITVAQLCIQWSLQRGCQVIVKSPDNDDKESCNGCCVNFPIQHRVLLSDKEVGLITYLDWWTDCATSGFPLKDNTS